MSQTDSHLTSVFILRPHWQKTMPLLTKSGDLQVTLMHAVLHNTTVYTTQHTTM